LKFYEGGLAYQKDGMVNWDPIDLTVLANEQVDGDGRSWRSGAIVEKKALKQWYFKITDYAEQLLTDLEQLSGWPEKVRTMQANWIGKSIGANLEFPIVGASEKIAVFTTRPDTVYGVSYIVLAPEHPLTVRVTTSSHKAAVDAFVAEIKSQSEIDRTAEDKPKRGVFTGAMAMNPFTGAEVPIWIADYVLYEYGTGAVMGVPAHDIRDFKFAKQYQLPITQVITSFVKVITPAAQSGAPLTAAYTEDGIMVNSSHFNGLGSIYAKQAIINYAEQQGYGNGKIQYKLRDWLISRQRYWGAPIPMIHCPKCGTVPVPEADLPVRLPEDVVFTGKGGNPLAQLESWVNVPCPSCGAPAKRETDTMDTFVDSSWYFLRYPDAQNDTQIFDPNLTNDWMPIDQYVGGIEHAVLHLLYARFFTKIVRDFGAGDRGKTKLLNFDEPFQNLLTQGMVQSTTYKNPQTGKYIDSATVLDRAHPTDPLTGNALEVTFDKMSKSKYNGIAPEEVIGKYGVDTARMFILFKAPPEKDLEWDDADVEGQFRFLNRMWRLVMGAKPGTTVANGELSKSEKDLRRFVHHAIQAITEDLDGDYQFNTAVSELMKLSNALTDADCKDSPVYAEGIETLMILAAPFAPHMTEELWQLTGHSGSIHEQPWRNFDPAALIADEITLVIQIMGKTRGTIQIPATKDSATLEAHARESAITKKFTEGKEIKKVIVVPGKLVNFIIG
jgi:leucyl-tRNA synthetase